MVTTTGSQFPGQSAGLRYLQDNSRGISARYTYVITPNIVNTLNFGYTRLGIATTGIAERGAQLRLHDAHPNHAR